MEDREIFFTKNFQDAEHPIFFVAHELQTLRIESMKPIESPLAFWKNMDKVFLTRHREQLIELVPQSLLETSCKMDWFRFIFWLILLVIRSLPTLYAWLFVNYCDCFVVEIQKLNLNSKRCPKG